MKDGDHLFQLVNTDMLEFEATVPAQYAGQLRAGSAVALFVSGVEQGVSVSGKVSRVNAAVDPSTRQVKVYVTVPNPQHRLVGGLFASGRVVLREARDALAVQRTGVRIDRDTTYVLVVEGGKIARRTVLTGITDEIRALIEIKRGLSPGDTAVVGPAEGMKVGDRIQVVGREG